MWCFIKQAKDWSSHGCRNHSLFLKRTPYFSASNCAGCRTIFGAISSGRILQSLPLPLVCPESIAKVFPNTKRARSSGEDIQSWYNPEVAPETILQSKILRSMNGGIQNVLSDPKRWTRWALGRDPGGLLLRSYGCRFSLPIHRSRPILQRWIVSGHRFLNQETFISMMLLELRTEPTGQ